MRSKRLHRGDPANAVGSLILGIVLLILAVIFVILVLCWLFLPFILMGTNSRLDKLIAEQRATNAILEARLPDLRRK